ncbi:MAG: T9SS type A sorting domain-containing protein [Aureispira sp.]
MNPYLLSLIFTTVFFYSSQAQRFDWAQEVVSTTWSYPSTCKSISYDSIQDCIYISGRQNSNEFIRKVSATGTVLWQKNFASRVHSGILTHDSQGNVYMVGAFTGTIDLDPSPHPNDTFWVHNPPNQLSFNSNCFVLKLTSNGEFVWGTTLNRQQRGQADAIQVDNQGNVYVVGVAGGINFIEKIDAQGHFVWKHELGTCRPISIYNSFYYHTNNIAIDDNYLYIIGDYEGTVDLDPSPNSSFMVQSNGEADNFLLKLDLNGNFIWANSFGNEYREHTGGISVDAQGMIYTTGVYFVQATNFVDRGPFYYLRKHSAQGRELVFQPIHQNILALDASQNGYLYATGEVGINTGNTDVIIQKWDTDNTLNLRWTQQIISSYKDAGLGIAVTPSEDIYTVGYFEGIVDFDLGAGTYYLRATGQRGGFILKQAPQNIAIPYLQSLKGIELYPNPTQGTVRIDSEEIIEGGTIELLNTKGQSFYRSPLNDNYFDLDLSPYPSGVYLVRIRTNEKTATLKVVKK